MLPLMKPLLLLAIFVLACRPSDGGTQQSAPGTAAATARGDSARADSLLALADAGRIQGAATAPVWLVEISDFQCPFCKQWHDQTYPQIKRDYIDRGLVRMAYVHLPLNIHPNAPAAAEASLCASVQGRFWPMHDRLFETQQRWAGLADPRSYFDSLATSVGVERARYGECMQGGLMQRVINGDRSRAASAGARSTPVFFVGDEPIQGAAPYQEFRAAIERQRAKAGAARQP